MQITLTYPKTLNLMISENEKNKPENEKNNDRNSAINKIIPNLFSS